MPPLTREDLLAALDALMAGRLDSWGVGALRTVRSLRRKAEPWLSDENVQGLGIAPKLTAGYTSDDLALKVYVARKLPMRHIPSPVPPFIRIPGLPEPVMTDVEEIGHIQLEARSRRVRPAVPGYGIGRLREPGGTFGCLVRRAGSEVPLYILSNSHVLARDGTGMIGDPIIQPADEGRSTLADAIADLSAWVPFQFGTHNFVNLVDAAIAVVRSPHDVTSHIAEIGVPEGIDIVLYRGMQVKKSGRRTDTTTGIIKDIDFRTAFRYRTVRGTARAGFSDQVLCTRFTEKGDSGAVVLNSNNRIVGLHFAGSSSASVFSRVGHVLRELDIEPVTELI